METISAFQAKTRFGDLLTRVARGEEIVITRHEKPVARLVPEGRPANSEIRDAVAELRQLRQSMLSKRGFKRIPVSEILAARNDGRR